MLHRFFILAFLILLPQLAPAQFQAGLRVGYSFYRFTSPDDGHYGANYTDYNNSFIIGLYGSIISSPHFSVGAELQYLHREPYSFPGSGSVFRNRPGRCTLNGYLC